VHRTRANERHNKFFRHILCIKKEVDRPVFSRDSPDFGEKYVGSLSRRYNVLILASPLPPRRDFVHSECPVNLQSSSDCCRHRSAVICHQLLVYAA